MKRVVIYSFKYWFVVSPLLEFHEQMREMKARPGRHQGHHEKYNGNYVAAGQIITNDALYIRKYISTLFWSGRAVHPHPPKGDEKRIRH
jgi:hypothetical protein